MAWSFSWYSARDLVLLFVTKMICFPGGKKGGVGVWLLKGMGIVGYTFTSKVV